MIRKENNIFIAEIEIRGIRFSKAFPDRKEALDYEAYLERTYSPEAKKERKEIKIRDKSMKNISYKKDCILIPRRAGRCKMSSGCPEYEKCLDYASRHFWPGFGKQGERKEEIYSSGMMKDVDTGPEI